MADHARFFDIRRTGDPTRRGDAWQVPLSGATPSTWQLFFRDATVTTARRIVSIRRGKTADYVMFNADESELPNWIDTIDECIRLANASYRGWLEQLERER